MELWRFMLGLLILLPLGCGTYEYRNRPDNSEVAVIRDIQQVFPEFATEFTGAIEGLKILDEGTLGRGEIKQHIVRLYELKDQLNAQLRDFVVARYQSYINSELDPDVQARERGRTGWNEVTAKIHSAALEIRKNTESLKEALRQSSEAKKTATEFKKKKLSLKSEISKTGEQIQNLVLRTKEPEAKIVLDQVVFAKNTIDHAVCSEQISKVAICLEEIPKAKVEAKKISSAVSVIWGAKLIQAKEPIGKKALELSNELERSLDSYEKLAGELQQEEIRVDRIERDLKTKLDLAADTIKTLGAQLAPLQR